MSTPVSNATCRVTPSGPVVVAAPVFVALGVEEELVDDVETEDVDDMFAGVAVALCEATEVVLPTTAASVDDATTVPGALLDDAAAGRAASPAATFLAQLASDPDWVEPMDEAASQTPMPTCAPG